MKIFNWMHRRFHHNHKDHEVVGRDANKNELVKNENDKNNDTVALLKHAALANVLDGWTGGILTIGTLGFDPLTDLKKQQKDYYYSDNDNEEEEYGEGEYDHCSEINVDEEVEGEMDPLMFKAFENGFDQNDHGNSHCGEVELVKPSHDDDVVVKLKSLDCDEKKKRGERITLADLFSADADMEKKMTGHVHVGSVKKAAAANIAKNGISFTKKIIPGVKQDSRPIKKLHKLMTKMLKKKIHPDIEGKILKKETEPKPNELQVLNIDENGAAESVSLLQLN